jgi:hypothetical protein
MEKEIWKEYLKNEKERYKNLRYIECPAFNNERIYFNNYGFDHIIYKGKNQRPIKEVIERFKLLLYVPNILRKIKNVDREDKSIKDKSCAYFWTISYTLSSSLTIKIIIRRLNNSPLHFFSVMRKS